MPRPASSDRLLFIGDSITECCRDRTAPPLGGGYVQFVHCLFAARHPELALEFVNRGIDGETVVDLARRWDEDVIALRPDWLFVMIGVNDVLYAYSDDFRERAVDEETYRRVYDDLLRRTRSALGDVRIVLMDPTPLEEDLASPSHALMRQRAAIVAELAARHGTEHIPTFERVLGAFERAPDRGWLVDVPHPNLAGQAVIALAVLEHLGW